MSKPGRNDISIGPKRWIAWIDLAGRSEEAVDIDGFLEPIEGFLKLLETECVAECCGIDAFGLWPDDIDRAKRQWGNPLLVDKVAAVRSGIANFGGRAFTSRRLNNLFDRLVLLEVLDHIGSCLSGNALNGNADD